MGSDRIADYTVFAALVILLVVLGVRLAARIWYSEKERYLNRFMKKLEKENKP